MVPVVIVGDGAHSVPHGLYHLFLELG
jgi:hypothetical protein